MAFSASSKSGDAVLAMDGVVVAWDFLRQAEPFSLYELTFDAPGPQSAVSPAGGAINGKVGVGFGPKAHARSRTGPAAAASRIEWCEVAILICEQQSFGIMRRFPGRMGWRRRRTMELAMRG